MADKDGSDQTFTFGTVVILVASILEKEGSLGMNDYKRMSVLDGTRGASSFDHMFRKVKARAKALNEQAKAEGGMTPVKKTKATGGSYKKRIESTSGKKRDRKPSNEERLEDGDDAEESPSKKVKAEPAEDSEADDAVTEPNHEFEF